MSPLPAIQMAHPRRPSEVQPELAARLLDVARAIDNVLVAGHTQRHWLQPYHPPFRPAETGDRGSMKARRDVLAAAVSALRRPVGGAGPVDHVPGGGRAERGNLDVARKALPVQYRIVTVRVERIGDKTLYLGDCAGNRADARARRLQSSPIRLTDTTTTTTTMGDPSD